MKRPAALGRRRISMTQITKAALLARVEALEKALADSLEQQTATSEILRVISSSPTDAQPVFESIAASALRLCGVKLCTVFRFDGKLIHLAALHHVSTQGIAAYRDAYPAPPGRSGGTHRAILTELSSTSPTYARTRSMSFRPSRVRTTSGASSPCRCSGTDTLLEQSRWAGKPQDHSRTCR
jgi:two-component system, NtrC family, sensor kinase